MYVGANIRWYPLIKLTSHSKLGHAEVGGHFKKQKLQN